MIFKSKKIPAQQTLGQSLKTARRQLGYGLHSVSLRLQISRDYLTALEKGTYQDLPEDVYSRNFLKQYAHFLSLDYTKLLPLYQQERKLYQNLVQRKWDATMPVKKLPRMHFLATPRIIRNVLIAIVALVCFTYLGVKVEAIIKPPLLIVETPQSDVLTTQNVLEVSGKTELDATLRINGEIVLLDEQGNFNKQVHLQDGINIFEISAKTDHSKSTIIHRRVVFTPHQYPDE